MVRLISPGVMEIHGIVTNTYNAWRGMRNRCESPKHPNYDRYGQRGIKVCERWQDFRAFQSDMGERPTIQHTIERLNNDGDYEPDNCVWADRLVQARNQERTVFVEFDGERMPMAQAAEIMGVSYYRLHSQLRRHGKFDRVPRHTKIVTDQEIKEMKWLVDEGERSLFAISKAYGIGVSLLNDMKFGRRHVGLVGVRPDKEIPLGITAKASPYLLSAREWSSLNEIMSRVQVFQKGALARFVSRGWMIQNGAQYKTTDEAYKEASEVSCVDGKEHEWVW